jgi:predicted secreted protein
VDATPVNAAPGTEIVLQLAASPTTGYVWQARSVPPGLTVVGQSFAPADSKSVGGGGVESVRVLVNASGTYDLVFELKRPWESQAVKSQAFRINAKP